MAKVKGIFSDVIKVSNQINFSQKSYYPGWA